MDGGSQSSTNNSENWKFSNRNYSKSLIKFLCQTILLYFIICTSIINLSINNGDSNIWVSLLSFSVGVIQNAPKLAKKDSIQNVAGMNV